MEDIPLCSKLYRNIVKQAPSKHNFITMFYNNSLIDKNTVKFIVNFNGPCIVIQQVFKFWFIIIFN